jgi:hypothetical protein
LAFSWPATQCRGLAFLEREVSDCAPGVGSASFTHATDPASRRGTRMPEQRR